MYGHWAVAHFKQSKAHRSPYIFFPNRRFSSIVSDNNNGRDVCVLEKMEWVNAVVHHARQLWNQRMAIRIGMEWDGDN